MIKRIIVKNFKSFNKLDLKLNNLNVLIGANASGKSNFIEIFKFLHDLKKNGLENAISMQGGVDYFRNIRIGKKEEFSIKIVFHGNEKIPVTIIGKNKLYIDEITYEFSLNFNSRKGKLSELGYNIAKDQLNISYIEKFGKENYKKIGSIKLKNLKRGLSKSSKEFNDSTIDKILNVKMLSYIFDNSNKILKDKLIIETPLFLFFGIMNVTELFGRNKIYYFDTRLSQKAVPFTGKIDLDEDGGNIAVVIKNIKKNKEDFNKLLNLIKNLLPIVDDLDVESFCDRSIFFELKEQYSKSLLPAFCISDGSINIIALVIALYFDHSHITIIEEPERNIHPSLISKVAEMLNDAAQNKQIIISTHSPELLKHVDLSKIPYIARSKEGYSRINKLLKKTDVKEFLKNEIGVDELFIQNLI